MWLKQNSLVVLDGQVWGECSQGIGLCQSWISMGWGTKEQLIVQPGSGCAAELVGGCSMGFSFPVQGFLDGVGLHSSLVKAGLGSSAAGCGRGKCSDCT